jgi:hypothetical protein
MKTKENPPSASFLATINFLPPTFTVSLFSFKVRKFIIEFERHDGIGALSIEASDGAMMAVVGFNVGREEKRPGVSHPSLSCESLSLSSLSLNTSGMAAGNQVPKPREE